MKIHPATTVGSRPSHLTRILRLSALTIALGLLLTHATASTDFAAGSGTEADPYLIASPEHLDQVRHHPNAHFRQIAHIDLNTLPWSEGDGWDPIMGRFDPWSINEGMDFDDQDVAAFRGSYDGNGYAILNLRITSEGDWDHGGYALFGLVGSGAVISDLHLINVSIMSDSFYTAPLVAYNAGTVTRCYADGQVTAHDHYAGGLVGTNVGTVSQSYSAVSVYGGMDFGGIAGANWGQGMIEDCYFTGTLNGDGIRGGGIVGWNEASVRHCYVAGQVAAESETGWDGMVYFDIGYIVSSWGEGFAHSCYWDATVNEVAPNVAVGGRETSEMMSAATYSNWDFDEIWTITEGSSYPWLAQNHYTAPEAYDTITITTDPVNSGTASGAGLFARGSTITVTATPAPGMIFTGWSSGEQMVSTLPEYSFTVSGDLNLVARFEEAPARYTLALSSSPNEGGTVMVTPQQADYEEGTPVQILATAGEGYVFTHWSVDGNSTDNPMLVTMDSDKVISAHFREVFVPLVSGIIQQPVPESSWVSLQVVAVYASTYQWYLGESGDTSTPISDATEEEIIVNPSTTTAFWVRAFSQDGLSADSATIIVTRENGGGGGGGGGGGEEDRDVIEDLFGPDLYVFPGSTPGTDQWYFSFTFKSIYHYAGSNWFFFDVFDTHLYIESTHGSLEDGFWAYLTLDEHTTWIYTGRDGYFGDLRDTNGDGSPDIDDSLAGDQPMRGFIFIQTALPGDPEGSAWYFFGEYPNGNWIVNMSLTDPGPEQWHLLREP